MKSQGSHIRQKKCVGVDLLHKDWIVLICILSPFAITILVGCYVFVTAKDHKTNKSRLTNGEADAIARLI